MTVYRHFGAVLQMAGAAGYTFGLNTNGWNFAQTYTQILPYRAQLAAITFSLDGASARTRDQLRGQGSYRRVMQALSICMAEGLPFTLNMVVTAHNRHELATMADLAAKLGAQRLRFGHLMPSPLTTDQDFDLTPAERHTVEAEIWALRRGAALPVDFAPGYYTTERIPCQPLLGQEVNIDCYGNLTKCCHLLGHGEGTGSTNVIGNLQTISFSAAYQQMLTENATFHQAKAARRASSAWQDTDHFSCWYCANYYQKLDWLKTRTAHAWQPLIWADQGKA